MKTSGLASFVFIAIIAAVAGTVANGQVVLPTKRVAALEAAQQLLASRDATLPANLADPFHPPGFGGALDPSPVQPGNDTPAEPIQRPSGPRTDRELLAAIATAIRAPNVITMGGQQILIFGQKRVKAGDPLTINFEGTDYTLTVTAVDRTSFTLRLNREEYTRPIK